MERIRTHLRGLDLEGDAELVATIALELVDRCWDLNEQANKLERQIKALVVTVAPQLLDLPGCGVLSAAKIIGETAGVDRFKCKDAFARWNGTAPIPVWTGNETPPA